jgi:CheY-like chemotaxis protein
MTYSILWFDDRREYLDSIDQDALEKTISEWGFIPKLVLVDDPAEFIAHKPFKDFDLIVVDYNLGDNQPHGEEFIKSIREHNVLTEVVFYSANPAKDLWDAIRAKELEGIYVSGRDTVVSKIERVAQHSLHKVLDLNNMRGLIMAELGDLDLQFDALLALGWSSLEDDGRAYVATRFVSTSTEQLEKRRTELQACAASPSTASISALSDSSKRWDNLCRLQKKNTKLKDVTMPPFATDLLFPRNCLAHGIPRQEGSDLIFNFSGRDYVYSEQSSTQLRQTILAYREHLRKMELLLKEA